MFEFEEDHADHFTSLTQGVISLALCARDRSYDCKKTPQELFFVR